MNGRQHAEQQIRDFIESDEQGMLLTGTHQFEKHKLIMAIIGTDYPNASVLFRIDGMGNTTNPSLVGLSRQPKAGEVVRYLRCRYSFDATTRPSTWDQTVRPFSAAIVYPLDWMMKERKLEPLKELTRCRKISKVFYCSCKDFPEYDYSLLEGLYQRHVVFDSEEENPEYHQRVLDSQKKRY